MDPKAEMTGSMSDPTEVLVVRMTRPARVDLARAETVLGPQAARWLGEPAGEEAGRRDFVCDLELRVGPEGRCLFRRSAIVGLGQPRRFDDGWMVPVEWRAASLTPLFPVFAGTLRLRTNRLALEGYYAPPLGAVGCVLDRVLLGIAARGTGRWFLANLEAALRED